MIGSRTFSVDEDILKHLLKHLYVDKWLAGPYTRDFGLPIRYTCEWSSKTPTSI